MMTLYFSPAGVKTTFKKYIAIIITCLASHYGQAQTPPGEALHLTGSQWATINTNFSTIALDYTVEAWVKPMDATKTMCIFSTRGASGNNDMSFDMKLQGGNTIHADIGDANGSGGYTWATTAADVAYNYTVGQWYHIAYLVSWSGGYIKIYVNGALLKTINYSFLGPALFDANHYAGYIGSNRGNNANEDFIGDIDEFRITNRAVSVNPLADALSSSFDSYTNAFYHFDVNTGTGLNSSTTTSVTKCSNLSLNGSPTFVQSFAMVPPVTLAGYGITGTSFAASWRAPAIGTVDSYLLDVSTAADFSSFVSGYSAKVISGSASAVVVTGLTKSTKYYYRVGAVFSGVSGQTAYSNASNITTTATDPMTAPGNCLAFTQDYVTAPATAAVINGRFTVEAWVRPILKQGIQPFINTHNPGGNGFALTLVNPGSILRAEIGDGSKITTVDVSLNYYEGQWMHVAYVVYPTGYKLYLNGDLASSGTFTQITPLLLNSQHALELGRGLSTAIGRFAGALDEVKIYKDTLTQAQIQADKISTIPVAPASLVTYYNFDQGNAGAGNGTVVTLNDYMGNYNGALNGFALTGTSSNWVTSTAMIVPTLKEATNVGSAAFTVNWNAPIADNFDNYVLDVSTSPDFSSFVLAGQVITGFYDIFTFTFRRYTSFQVTGLSAGTTYYYRIRAHNNADPGVGQFAFSDYGTIATLPAITSIAPTSAYTGQPVTINGGGFTGATAVSFGGVAANSFTVVSDNVIKAVVSTGASGNVSITTTRGVITLGGFTLIKLTPPGNALYFDGTDDYVSATSGATTVNGKFTVEAWVQPADTTGSMVIVSTRQPNNFGFDMKLAGSNKVRVDIGDGSKFVTADAAVNYIKNQWLHIAYTVYPTGYKLYVNGNLVSGGSFAAIIPLLLDAQHNLYIGSYAATNELFKGLIDEVKIYSDTLSQANIQADMVSTSAAVPASLVAHYDFDAGVASDDNTGLITLFDEKNNYNGTLKNFALNGAASNWLKSYAMVVPPATVPTSVTTKAFTANWTAPALGTVDNYLLDVSATADFTSMLIGYNAKVIAGTVTSAVITGLSANTTYYYRVRASFTASTTKGASSNIISVTTTATTLPAPGNALYFDGSNDYVLTPTNSQTVTGSFTVEAWVMPANTNAGSMNIISTRQPTDYGFDIKLTGGNKIQANIGGPGVIYTKEAVINYAANRWMHIACTVYPAGYKIYVNGSLASSGLFSQTIPMLLDASHTVFIGALQGTGEFFNGAIDEVRLYKDTLTQPQILADMFSTAAAVPANLVAYYNFDQGVASANNPGETPLYDETNTYNGTLKNFILSGTTGNWVKSNAMVVPATTNATAVASTAFTANWSAPVFGPANSYALDVSANPAFSSFVGAYNGKAISGNSLSATVTGLSANTTYYYRVRANLPASTGQGIYSNTTGITTAQVLTPPGNALYFDGTNDYVSTATGATSVNNKFTIEAWVLPYDTVKSMCIISTRQPSEYGFDVKLLGNNRVRADIGNGSAFTTINSPVNYTTGRWMHLAYTVYPTGYRLYINGGLADSGSYAQKIPALLDTLHNLFIGSYAGSQELFNGAIDEVKIYSDTLTQAQVQADMVSTSAAVPAKLVSYYNFDAGIAGSNNPAATTVYDQTTVYTGTANNFGLNGAASNWVKSYAAVVPTITAASTITGSSFIANWTAPATGAVDNYLLDVSATPNFSSFVEGYNAKVITGTSTSSTVTGLSLGTTYYYRVRADLTALTGQGAFSKTQSLATLQQPGITDITPASASSGQTVTISGAGFTGVTAVSFNGVAAASFTLVSDNVIKAVVATGASGNVSVTNPAATTNFGGFVFTTLTPPGNALNFDGINDFVSTTATSTTVNNKFTVEAWVRPTDITKSGVIISTRQPSDLGFDMKLLGNKKLRADIGIGTGFNTVDDTVAYGAGRWMHIAYSVYKTGYKLYVNGALVSSRSFSQATPLLLDANHAIYIGATGTGEYFQGSIDEVKVYNDTLTQAQVREDMLNTTPIAPANLVAYYNFDIGTAGVDNAGAITLYDQKNTYNGTLKNFSLNGTSSNWLQSYAMVVPVATAATSVYGTGFTANWTAPRVGSFMNYILDVSTTPDFSTLVSGYPRDVYSTSIEVTGLANNTTYYYKVRSSSLAVFLQGANSNTITIKTLVTPVITGISQAYADSGKMVAIRGSGFTGATAVSFGGVQAGNSTVMSDTLIKAIVGNGATGNVLVTTPGGAASYSSFTYASLAPGNALHFDGAGGYVSATAVSDAGVDKISADYYTLEAWIRPDVATGNHVIISSLAPGALYGVSLRLQDKELIAELTTGNPFSPATKLVSIFPVITPGQWMHVAFTYYMTGYKFYINGKLAGSGTPATYAPFLITPDRSLIIGGLGPQWPDNWGFNGAIDEVKVYKDTLTQANIQADMVSTSAAVPTKLLLYYNFNNGIAGADNAGLNTLYNQLNRFDGTLTNFALSGATGNWIESYAMVQPAILEATNISNTGFTANWSVPVNGIVDNGYRLYVSTDPLFSSTITGYNGITVNGTSQPVTGLARGETYYYHVSTDKTSVTGQGAFSGVAQVKALAKMNAALSTTADSVCKNATGPRVIFKATDGAAPYTITYTVNGGTPQIVITGNGDSALLTLPTGMAGAFKYSLVSVTDDKNFTDVAADSVLVTVKEPPTSTTPVTVCSTALPYAWNGQSYNAAGTYTFTTSSATGCDSIATLVLNVTTTTLNAIYTTAKSQLCFDGQINTKVTAHGGAAPYEYSIDGGANYQALGIFKVGAGAYTATVKDATGCVLNAGTLNITQAAAPVTVSINTGAINCNNDTIKAIAAGGYGGYMYSINGEGYLADSVFKGLTAGIYRISVSDINGCKGAKTANLTALTAALKIVDSTVCFGKIAALRAIGKYGFKPYSYSVDNGASYQTGNIFKLPASTLPYNVLVKDSAGCIVTTNSVTVSQPAIPVQITTTQTNVLCNGGSDGSITVSGMGGYTEAYTYAINSVYLPSNVFSNLQAGLYKISVRDSGGCVVNKNVTIRQPLTPCTSLIATSTETSSHAGNIAGILKVKVYPNPAVTEFNIEVVSGDDKKVVELRVTDMMGKTVYQTRGSIHDMFKFGRALSSGIYIAEILNGKNVERVKLVKGN